MSELAITGGTPVRSTFLPYGRQQIEEEDIAAVISVLRSDWLTTGPKIEEFEDAFTKRIGIKHALAFSSGTAALHAAVFAAGLGPGDEAITAPLTFAASANCLLYQGATPVFADISNRTLTIDPEKVSRAITQQTRAIIPVDYAGHPADLDEIREVANQNDLMVIEDAAHALGATYRGRNVGCIADMTVFSFHPVKHITTGEGGIVTTDNPELAARLKIFRNHGFSSDARTRQKQGSWFYEMIELGFNYRLTDFASALGISQLRRLDSNLKRRREIADKYMEGLSDIPTLVIPHTASGVEHAWHLYPVRLDLTRIKSTRGDVFRALHAENIGVNVHYIPVHLHPYYRRRFGYAPGAYPVAEAAYESLLSLPMFHSMTDQDIKDVIEAMHKILGELGT